MPSFAPCLQGVNVIVAGVGAVGGAVDGGGGREAVG